MKRASLLISAVLLFVTAGVQTAMAQKVTLYSAGSKAYECDIAQLDSIVFSEGQTIPDEEIVVTVDAYGIAQGEHWFEEIDETNYYIDDIKYTVQNGDLVVIGYNETFFKGEARIISKLKYPGRTMNVVEIWENAFKDCGVLTSVTIPESVTSIGDGVFWGCNSLTSITIPNSVTSIGYEAFYECTSLTSVTLESNNIVSAARDRDSSMRTIFGNQVEEYIIGNSVTSIGNYAFYECSSLTSITIPESVTSIGDCAFIYCTSLTSITIPNGVTCIGSNAFSSCTSLASIIILNGVTDIGNNAFHGCTSLTSVTIPESVTSIGARTFYQCI